MGSTWACRTGAALVLATSRLWGATSDSDELPPNIEVAQPAETDRRDAGTRNEVAQSRAIEEIVVTAQKREENLQDVPVSIQAFSSDLLDAKGVKSIQDLPQITPGLTVTTQASYTSTFIRGIGSDVFLFADPSVANYVDGIYLPLSSGSGNDFGDVERIEILKGPQGTLFGRNAIGGAINIVSKKPSTSEVRIAAQSGYGSFDAWQNRAYVSVPFDDTLAVSASALYNIADNPVKGRSAGQPLPKEVVRAFRLKALWAPQSWMELCLTAAGTRASGAGTTYSVNTEPSVLGYLAGIRPGDPYAGANDGPNYFAYRSNLYYGQLSLFAPGFDVKLLGSRQDVGNIGVYDLDGSAMPLASISGNPFAKAWTGELQLISNDESWGKDWVKWITGAYYFSSRSGSPRGPGYVKAAGTDLNAGLVLGTSLPDPLLGQIRDLLDGAPIPSGTIGVTGLIDTRSVSAFGQATFTLADWLSLTIGGRYQTEKRKLIESSSDLQNLDGSTTPIQSFGGLQDTTSGFKPKLGVEIRAIDDVLFYLTWQQAVKSSTYNVVNLYNAPELVKAEQIEAYEVGMKSRLFDGLMTLNTAAFWYTLDNAQVQFISLFNGGVASFENAGNERVRGVEIETVTLIAPDTINGLVLTLGATALDPKYTSYPDGSGFNEQGLLVTGQDYTGNQIVRSAKFSGAAGLLQTINVPHGTLEMGIDYYHTSRFFFLAQNSPADEEKSYGLLGASVSYLFEPWNMRITAYGRNLTNTHYNYGRAHLDFGTNDAAAPLRNFGFYLSWDLAP